MHGSGVHAVMIRPSAARSSVRGTASSRAAAGAARYTRALCTPWSKPRASWAQTCLGVSHFEPNACATLRSSAEAFGLNRDSSCIAIASTYVAMAAAPPSEKPEHEMDSRPRRAAVAGPNSPLIHMRFTL